MGNTFQYRWLALRRGKGLVKFAGLNAMALGLVCAVSGWVSAPAAHGQQCTFEWQPTGYVVPPVDYYQNSDFSVGPLIVYSGNLIVVSSFSVHVGLPSYNISQWNGDSWSDLGAKNEFWFLHALIEYNGALVKGGQLNYFLEGRSGISQWNGSSWSPLATGLDLKDTINGTVTVYDLCVYNGNLIACGDFGKADGLPANGIAQWNGSTWSALGSGLTGCSNCSTNVEKMIVYNGNLIAAGPFITAGGKSANHIAQWNGSSWSALGGGLTGGKYGFVWALCVYNDALIAVGDFTTAGGVPVPGIAQWNGSSWSALGDGPTGCSDLCPQRIGPLTVYNGVLIASGSFTTAEGSTSAGIAQWNGNSWSALGNGTTGCSNFCLASAGALTVYNGALITWGSFTSSSGERVTEIGQYLCQPNGSCCAADSTCAVTTKRQCSGIWTEGGTCDPNTCPLLEGSCCADDGTCTLTMQANCSGAWTQNGSCSPNICLQPTGSCCGDDGSCAITAEAGCSGVWMQGGGCDPNVCPAPSGSCCAGDGICTLTTQGNCSGTWTQDGSCAPNTCVPPSGSCCSDDGTCSLTLQGDCLGTWTRDGICSADSCQQPQQTPSVDTIHLLSVVWAWPNPCC